MMKIGVAILCLFMFLSFSCSRHEADDPSVPAVPFFGQPWPEDPVIFTPGFISTGLEELVITFMPDGRECYWSVMFSGFETILTSRLSKDGWSKPEVAPFAGAYYDGWPSIQPDGSRLFFHSGRPVADSTLGITAEFNIWVMERKGEGWSEPCLLLPPVNGTENSTCPTLTRTGTLYFSKRFSDDTEKLVRSRLVNGQYRELEILPEVVNGMKYNFHGTISPDETCLVRPIYGRSDAIGAGWNYYVLFRDENDRWSEPVNLGEEVNNLLCGGASSFSPDGKTLFFQARIRMEPARTLDTRCTLKEMLERERWEPGRGSSDIYTVDARLVHGIKQSVIRTNTP